MIQLPAGVQSAATSTAKSLTGGGAGGGGFDWRVLLGALSSLAPHLVEARNARRAQEELAGGEAATMAAQANADKRIGDEVMEIQKGPEPERAAAQADYTRAVRQARDQGDSSTSTTLGGATFKADAAKASGAQAAYGNTAANQFARMDAPIRQRERETRGVANAGVDVRRELNRGSSADFLARLRATNRARTSPWAAILGQLGQRIAGNFVKPRERTIR